MPSGPSACAGRKSSCFGSMRTWKVVSKKSLAFLWMPRGWTLAIVLLLLLQTLGLRNVVRCYIVSDFLPGTTRGLLGALGQFVKYERMGMRMFSFYLPCSPPFQYRTRHHQVLIQNTSFLCARTRVASRRYCVFINRFLLSSEGEAYESNTPRTGRIACSVHHTVFGTGSVCSTSILRLGCLYRPCLPCGIHLWVAHIQWAICAVAMTYDSPTSSSDNQYVSICQTASDPDHHGMCNNSPAIPRRRMLRRLQRVCATWDDG